MIRSDQLSAAAVAAQLAIHAPDFGERGEHEEVTDAHHDQEAVPPAILSMGLRGHSVLSHAAGRNIRDVGLAASGHAQCQAPLTPHAPYSAQVYATAYISMLEGLLKLLREKNIVTDEEVRALFADRAQAWDCAAGSLVNTQVATLLRYMAGGAAPPRNPAFEPFDDRLSPSASIQGGE